MPNIKKIINFLVSFVIIFTFFTSLFTLIYVELYAKAGDNIERSIELEKYCFGLTQPLGGMAFYHGLFPFTFLMIKISAIIVLMLYIFIFLKTFKAFIRGESHSKSVFIMFAIFMILILFLVPLSFFFASIMTTIITIILAIIVFNQLKISFYNKYKLAFFTFLIPFSQFLLLGAWIDADRTLYKCAELYLR